MLPFSLSRDTFSLAADASEMDTYIDFLTKMWWAMQKIHNGKFHDERYLSSHTLLIGAANETCKTLNSTVFE